MRQQLSYEISCELLAIKELIRRKKWEISDNWSEDTKLSPDFDNYGGHGQFRWTGVKVTKKARRDARGDNDFEHVREEVITLGRKDLMRSAVEWMKIHHPDQRIGDVGFEDSIRGEWVAVIRVAESRLDALRFYVFERMPNSAFLCMLAAFTYALAEAAAWAFS